MSRQNNVLGFLESHVVKSNGRGQSKVDVHLSLADRVTLASLQWK